MLVKRLASGRLQPRAQICYFPWPRRWVCPARGICISEWLVRSQGSGFWKENKNRIWIQHVHSWYIRSPIMRGTQGLKPDFSAEPYAQKSGPCWGYVTPPSKSLHEALLILQLNVVPACTVGLSPAWHFISCHTMGRKAVCVMVQDHRLETGKTR